MIDSQLPCVAVFSDFVNPEKIVKQILKRDELPECVSLGENLKLYPWNIDTKYYKANVNICPVRNGDIFPSTIHPLTEGLILYFDSKIVESFENIKKWRDSVKGCPEVLLLICDSFKEVTPQGVRKSEALDWCLQNSYELIELEDTEAAEDDYNDIIPDKRGIDRVVEALHAHTWSNLDMKSNCKPNGVHASEMNIEEETEDFCELFSQLHSMKESIQSLPLKDRRTCAEQVVATFWKAIGGDDEEIEDILP